VSSSSGLALSEIGKNVEGIEADVSNLADLHRLYDTVKQQKGRIDVLFANAGIVEFAPLGSITESHFDKIISVNLKGLLFTVQKALPLFQAGGSIILTASVGGSKGFEGLSVYDATKAAIRSFARSWTVDLKHRKIRVNAISPGPTDTPMVSSAGMGLSEEQVDIPLDSSGNPTVSRYGVFTVNFKPSPPPIPPEYSFLILSVIISSLIGWSIPSIIGWVKARTQRKHLEECITQIGKLDKNAMEEKIIGYYVEGKISEDHRQLLKDKISEYYENQKSSE
jgi:short-subunit dehydrogenase involved in D-alanine esterification of teichoic acids